jgi:MoxR-like ATPase
VPISNAYNLHQTLLPADVLGTLIYSPSKGEFTTKKGPIFTNLLLADEINRAPAKVQSALLEGMQERQVTIGDETYPLPQPFLVLATENPIDQEGLTLSLKHKWIASC